MRLVETVLRKFFQQVEHRVRLLRWDGMSLLAAFHENESLTGHLGCVFFTHGTAEKVGLAE